MLKFSTFYAIVTSFLAHLRIKVFFTQIIQLELPSTQIFFLTIFDHLCKLTITEHFTRSRRVLIFQDHWLKGSSITSLIKQDTFCWITISPRSSTFLIIIFQRFRERIMNDKPYIRLVYAHSKSNCCYDNSNFVLHPHLLNLTLVIIM